VESARSAAQLSFLALIYKGGRAKLILISPEEAGFAASADFTDWIDSSSCSWIGVTISFGESSNPKV